MSKVFEEKLLKEKSIERKKIISDVVKSVDSAKTFLILRKTDSNLFLFKRRYLYLDSLTKLCQFFSSPQLLKLTRKSTLSLSFPSEKLQATFSLSFDYFFKLPILQKFFQQKF